MSNNKELNEIIEKIENFEPSISENNDNLLTSERKALNDLRNNKNITIKKADKGGNIVILNSDFYREKLVLFDHLATNTYKLTDENCDVNVMEKLKRHVNTYKQYLTKNEYDYLINFEWKTSEFYVLPKIHKCQTIKYAINESNNSHIHLPPPNDLKGRPIVAGHNSPTHRLSTLLEKILAPLATMVKTYVKDDWNFLRLLPSTMNFKKTIIYSVDIESLYTSISHDLGIEAIIYWIDKLSHVIPTRFTKEFIIESLLFVLKNNNFIFEGKYYKQENGTAMGTNVAPPYAILTIAYLEEAKLFPHTLPKYFTPIECRWIEEHYKRYMDDGFIFLLNSIDVKVLLKCLNSLHPLIKFTEEKAVTTTKNGKSRQSMNFLDIEVILDDENNISTDIYYKPTNSHDYLNYKSDHPLHTKINIPYNLAKRIICFVTDPDRVKYRLHELKTFLQNCEYPDNVINKCFHNAMLQGPAPRPKDKSQTLPLVTTNYSNFRFNRIIKKSNDLIDNIKDANLKPVFENTNIVLSQKQPKNLMRLLSQPTKTPITNKESLIKKCNDKRCKICSYYLQCTSEFYTTSGVLWKIKSQMGCGSKNVIYYLLCNKCNETSYIGKTNNIRLRTNQHISTCRTGIGSDKFDIHVFNCNKLYTEEPFFKLFLMLKLKDDATMLTYESHLHAMGLDTMNKM